jgi:hypothetical protein
LVPILHDGAAGGAKSFFDLPQVIAAQCLKWTDIIVPERIPPGKNGSLTVGGWGKRLASCHRIIQVELKEQISGLAVCAVD